MKFNSILFGSLLLSAIAYSQKLTLVDPAKEKDKLMAVGVTFTSVKYKNKNALRVIATPDNPVNKLVLLKDLAFKNGIIETEIAAKVLPGAFEGARGFVGLAFRVGEDNEEFECFYLRPTNGRADDQLRRNHAVQYVSHPEYPWQRLRKENPGKYESYVDLILGEWTKIKITVYENEARLFVHGEDQPTLIVKDLKHGVDRTGALGLWIGLGTEAYFSKLRIASTEE